MKTETLTNTETHEVITTDAAGQESSVTEIHTSEVEVPVIPPTESAPVEVAAEVAAEIAEEGIDEEWLNSKFAEVNSGLAQLLTLVQANQLQQMELTNRLLEMNQNLQATITELAAKQQPNSSNQNLLLENPTPPTVEPPQDESAVVQQEAPTKPAKRKLRRI